MGDKDRTETIKLEISVGDVEVEFEGPADFARHDLVDLVGKLADRLVGLSGFGMDDDEDEEEEEDDEDDKHPAETVRSTVD